jgi:twitching motility protein PilU
MEFRDYLKIMMMKEGSDVFLSTGAPPICKIEGKMVPLEQKTMAPNEVKEIAYEVMGPEKSAEFEKRPEMNLALSVPGVGRFRVNIFQQRNQVAMVCRAIKSDAPRWQDLGLPEVVANLIMEKRGLLLFVGGTGSGKSTSLAALIDYRNANSTGHIITIEDPIEFVHKHKKSLVNQREVGIDTLTYHDALKETLRQAPDVILIGEIRDRETMEHAIAFAETGHLAISTLHANNANQAMDRIINFFPEERRTQLLLDLSLNIRGVVSQRLVSGTDGKRVAAFEILIGTSTVRDLLKRGDVGELKEVMEKGVVSGMQTFDHALFELYKEGRISMEEAVKNADSANNLRLKINMSEGKAVDDERDLGGETKEKAADPTAGVMRSEEDKSPFEKGGGGSITFD